MESKIPMQLTTTFYDGDNRDERRQINDDEYFSRLPAGFRFRPTDAELINVYLATKINNEALPPIKIHVAELYEFAPADLTHKYPPQPRQNDWYFFTPTSRKYANGSRPDRSAGNGHWRASGKDTPVTLKGKTIGFKRSLAFFEGKHKTEWLMSEYKINGSGSHRKKSANDMRLDDWVLCRVYKTKLKATKKQQACKEGEYHVDSDQTLADTPDITHSSSNNLEVTPYYDDFMIDVEELLGFCNQNPNPKETGERYDEIHNSLEECIDQPLNPNSVKDSSLHVINFNNQQQPNSECGALESFEEQLENYYNSFQESSFGIEGNGTCQRLPSWATGPSSNGDYDNRI